MPVEWSLLFWLLVVIAAIPLTLWAIKRSLPVGPGVAAGTARTVAVLPLSGTQRLVTGGGGRGEKRLWLVLGVTPGGIQNPVHHGPQDDGRARRQPGGHRWSLLLTACVARKATTT